MKRRMDPLLRYVESFFAEHLYRLRGASRHTLLAYRDALRLLFCFLAKGRRRSVARLRLDDIHADHVLAFLEHLEATRGNSVTTRNCRLAAIHCFVEHLLRCDPSRAAQYQRVLAITPKRTRTRPVSYLEPEEMKALLSQPDRTTTGGIRDYALLIFLYNTGARVSEALGVRDVDLHLAPPRQVRLHGKGGKERYCPIWRDTADALVQLIEIEDSANRPIFLNARGNPLSRDGVGYIVAKYTKTATGEIASLRRRRITPHVFRHSCAVALLQAGVDIAVIRDYLGHATVATTSRYVTANLQMRREVLEAFWKRAGLGKTGQPRWRPKPDVLAFLSSL